MNDLKKDKTYAGKVNIRTIKMGEPGTEKAIKDAKLTNHGIIGKCDQGKIIVTVDGHNYKKDKVVTALNKLLKDTK